MSSSSKSFDLTVYDVKPGVKFPKSTLQALLPDIETTLFFGKAYDLDYRQLSDLVHTVHSSDLLTELKRGDHSTQLQSYIVGIVPPVEKGNVSFSPAVAPKGEILPEVWKSLEMVVAQSIKDVAAKLSNMVAHLPGKKGQMVLQSMMQMNRRRPTVGTYGATITRDRSQLPNLIIVDDSGSVTPQTVLAMLDDVIAMSFVANASLALVSNSTRFWEAGQFDRASVSPTIQGGGTHYETLAPLFKDKEWGTVVTIADYDSSYSAHEYFRNNVGSGSIHEVVDISLVNRPTYLAEVVGQIATKVTPVLIASTNRVLAS